MTRDPNPSALPSLEPEGGDLLRLAAMLEKKLLLLEGLEQRRRVRKDPRLERLGLGFHEPVQEHLERNWRLIAFLCRSALEAGHATPECFRLLARALCELRAWDQALEVCEAARERDMVAGPLEGLRLTALLELDRAGEAPALQAPAGEPGTEVLRLVDYPAFSAWTQAAGAGRVTLHEEPVDAQGLLRVLQASGPVELDTRLCSTPLQAAEAAGLNVLAGYLPFKNGAGHYDLGLAWNLRDLAPVRAVSPTRAAFRADAHEIWRFAGDHLVPSAAYQYYGNYFHALCQICCRLSLALDSGRLPEGCGVLLPQATPRWVMQFLELLGVGPERVEFMPATGVSVIERGFVLPMKWDLCPAEIAHARGRLLDRAPAGGARRNYYLLRKNVANFTRALADEERFIRVCEDRGFTVVDPLDYTLAEQAALFRDAGVLVSSASSAYANMIFARPGLEMVLILPRLFWGMLSSDLATACGHSLTVLPGEFIAGSQGVSSPHHPYHADPDLLAAHLDRVLEQHKEALAS